MERDEHRIFVIVHGVGRQTELDTLRTVMEGSYLGHDTPSKFTRAELDELRRHSEPFVIDEYGRTFVEVCYSDSIDGHLPYTESDLKRWLRTFKSRLDRIHRSRTDGTPHDFSTIESIVDDIILTTRIASFIAERLKVKPLSFESSAVDFLQQIQLFIDRASYRESILDNVESQLSKIVAKDSKSKIVLISHSLGTVVTFIALLRAQESKSLWLNQVEQFITFGSPIDLFLVLFPEFFPSLSSRCCWNIPWTNYVLGNDPIATELVVANNWLPSLSSGLFNNDTISEINLGTGSIATAHTDYWHDLVLLENIFAPHPESMFQHDGTEMQDEPARSTEAEEELVPPQRIAASQGDSSSISGLALLGFIAVLASSWIGLIWWEENLKSHDAHRVLLLEGGIYQLLIWGAAATLVLSHAVAWSYSLLTRLVGFLISLPMTFIVWHYLPPLIFLPGSSGETSSLGFEDDIHISGSAILLLIPMTALIGLLLNRHRLPTKLIFSFLAITIIVMSLFIGTRSNPSNVTEEFGTLVLMFGFWMLAILLFRIDSVYRNYVRGRKHIDEMYKAWYKDNQPPHHINDKTAAMKIE